MKHKLIMVMLSVALIAGLVVSGCVKPAPPAEEVVPPVEEVVPPAEEEWEFLSIGTGSPGGVFYPLGGGIAVVIEKMTEHRCMAESTAASVENCRLLGKEMLTMATIGGATAWKARHGKDPFEQEYPLVALLNLYSMPTHFLTTEHTGIKTMQDLAGKKVSIDRPGAATNYKSRVILEAAGFDLEKDLKIVELSQAESVAALKDRTIDAMTLGASYPCSGVMDVNAARNLVLIPITEEMLEKVLDQIPSLFGVTIPAGTYSDVDYDVFCVGDSSLIVVRESMSVDLAYELTKVILENATEGDYALINIHPIAAQMTPENAYTGPIPFHAGAERYYKEVGVL